MCTKSTNPTGDEEGVQSARNQDERYSEKIHDSSNGGESGEAVDDGPGKGGIRIQSAWSSNTFKWNEGNGFL